MYIRDPRLTSPYADSPYAYWEHYWLVGPVNRLERLTVSYIGKRTGKQIGYDILAWLILETVFAAAVTLLTICGVIVAPELVILGALLLFVLNAIGGLMDLNYKLAYMYIERSGRKSRRVDVAENTKLFEHIAYAAGSSSFQELCESEGDVTYKPEIDQALRNPNIQDALEQIDTLSSSTAKADRVTVGRLWDFIDGELQPLRDAAAGVKRDAEIAREDQLERSRKFAELLLQIGEVKRIPIK